MAERGFVTPVFDAQRVFRATLTALSEPGRVVAFVPGCIAPGDIDPAAAALVLALCDADTPLWLAPSIAPAASFFRFHTGAPIVAAVDDAQFLLATSAERPALAALKAGTPEYPDRSATLILAVAALESDRGWQLSGPGIAESRRFLPLPVDQAFAGEWQQNHERFPLGVDIFFAARDRIAGLPRSTRLEA